MRVTQSRYDGELQRFSLALRMLGFQARTSTISRYTGLSSDRIRKAYASYLVQLGNPKLPRRKRGRPPSQVARFFNTPDRHCESTVLASLFMHAGLLDPDDAPTCSLPKTLSLLSVGQRLCDAYQMHRRLMPDGEISLELAAMMLHALGKTNELILADCEFCDAFYVHDAYALDYGCCPFCETRDRMDAQQNNRPRRQKVPMRPRVSPFFAWKRD